MPRPLSPVLSPMRSVLSLAVAAVLATASAAHGAPTAPETADGQVSSERDDRGLKDRLPVTDSVSGSRTIDLLIDMQQRSAGLQFNERKLPGRGEIKPRQASTPDVAAVPGLSTAGVTAARAEMPPPSPSGLFGSGATPMVQTARTASVEPRGVPGMEPAAPRRAGQSTSGEPLPRWLMLPRELIEYVRENRWSVLGSVAGGLLLIWGLSALFSRAAANAGRVPGTSGGRPDRALSAGRWDPPRPEARPGRRRSHRRPR